MGGELIRIFTMTLIALAFTGCVGKADNLKTFSEQVARCEPAGLTTDQALGAQGRYQVQGPDGDGCRVSFTFTRNPNADLVGRSLSFVVDPEQPVTSQLRDGVTACLEGRSGVYRCEGELFEPAGGASARSSTGHSSITRG